MTLSVTEGRPGPSDNDGDEDDVRNDGMLISCMLIDLFFVEV